MLIEVPPPDAVLRCDGCGEVWVFTADTLLTNDDDQVAFVEDCLEALWDAHDHGVPASPGYFTRGK